MTEKRAILSGMAKAGRDLAEASLLNNSNWVALTGEEYPEVSRVLGLENRSRNSGEPQSLLDFKTKRD